MITRLVTLYIREHKRADFRQFLKEESQAIRQVSGCLQLSVYEAASSDGCFVSHSVWENDAALQRYRDSEFFINNWTKIKPWFSSKAKAITLNKID